ncbi:MAG: GAF domain-containing sensor histidine kinase, partial [Actinomycetota bacterium]|nr:GAF domain-containing sensor histidine kinase [Actinomycetota bacterium]
LAGYMLFSGIAEAIGLLPPEGSVVDDVAGFLAFMAIPVSAGIGILKYRLFDVDIVIKKTVVFGLLAAFMTALYVGIVVGIGTLVAGAGTNRLLNIAAAVIIALAFQPARERARHLANRLVYGKRATPYEILSEFSERMGGAFAVEDLLPTMARILGEGTGANHAMVWLKVGKELRPAASWPEESLPRAAVPVAGEDVPAIANVDAVFAVKHQNELLGALSVTKPRGESLTPEEEKLLSGVASQAALVLRNVRLTAELQAKLEELQASRQRIVAAQDAERRRLERNIHDGAQQQLVALSVKLRLARQLSGRDHDRAEQMLSEVEQETIDALETLRDLARGIYPPLLADQGLPAALTAQARKVPLQVDVEPNGVGRYPQEVEAAVYFCCLEALQNMSKYAKASRAVVRLSAADGELRFQVQDDGVGFDPDRTPRGSGLQNMADRLAALEGTLEVSSRPGEGTTVAGSVPVKAVEPAMA